MCNTCNIPYWPLDFAEISYTRPYVVNFSYMVVSLEIVYLPMDMACQSASLKYGARLGQYGTRQDCGGDVGDDAMSGGASQRLTGWPPSC
jgi:hypothetical protein